MPSGSVATVRHAPGTALPIRLAEAHRHVRTHPAVLVRSALVFAAWLAVVVVIQIQTGAYRVEAGRYSDDAAHFMNGLVIRDYITTGLGQNPMTFAENYYLSYPKIAPLMWPPLFHVVLGLLMLVGAPPLTTALLLVGVTTAWLVWRLQRIVSAVAGPVPAFLAVLLTLGTNLVGALSGAVMLDIAVAAISLEAVYWLSRFVVSGEIRHANLFGLFAACACLTKGNGIAVLLTPPIMILLTGRYDLLRSRGLYRAAGIVLLGAMPILALSARYDAAIGDFGPVTASVVLQRILLYSRHLWIQLGPLLLTLAAAGMTLAVVPRFRRAMLSALGGGTGASSRAHGDTPLVEALAALVISTLVFHLLVPHRVAVSRYLTGAIAPAIGLGCTGLWTAVSAISRVTLRQTAGVIVSVILVFGAWISRPSARVSVPLGYREMLGYVNDRDELAGARILVVSDEVGEGAFVTEAARLGLQPAPTMIRGSKLLASDDWGGRFFKLRYATSRDLLKDLEDMHVSYVVIDEAARAAGLAYFDQILELTTAEPDRFPLAKATAARRPSGVRSLALHRVAAPTTGEPKPIEIPLLYSIGRSLSR